MTVNKKALDIVSTLRSNGFEAYLVGGCVRDTLMGRTPKDWDITTSAFPGTVDELFQDVVYTGIAHGTITVMKDGEGFEVTTYRVDGDYSDGRHPDQVLFCSDLKQDLARRDFTINAIAMDESGFVDPFDGLRDIEEKVIRCVGDPFKRFTEDKLRILRALRFASVLGFSIEDATLDAMVKLSGDVSEIISPERISVELHKMVDGQYFPDLMKDERCLDVFMTVFPEFAPMRGFNQNNPHHKFDVWEHTLETIRLADTPTLKLAALMHDMAKPAAYVEKDGVGHFYGHPELGSDLAYEFMTKYRFTNSERDLIANIVKYHDYQCGTTRKGVLRALNKLGPELLDLVVRFRWFDVLAQSEYKREEKLSWPKEVRKTLDTLHGQNNIYKVASLAVTGNDLKAVGYQEGKDIGKALRCLLDAVIDGSCPNEKEALLELAVEIAGLLKS